MKMRELFEAAIKNKDTNYLVVDSGNYEKDHDFVSYAWHRNRNNKIKADDVFIYRKPQKLSISGQFYFYGAGQFNRLDGENAVTGLISSSHPFKRHIMQDDIEKFSWQWKQRGAGWEHYWNQYGINQITKGVLSHY
jgi:putative restriction endonuclease